MMQVDRIRAKNLPPRATSSASSYHTTLERSATPSESVASLASTVSNHDSDVSSPPSTPELQYDIIQRRREGTALIIEHPTLVNFVPTSDIQTAVRVLPDCVIIDTILPPTATLRASDLSRQNPQVEGGKTEGGAISGFDAAELLKRHEAEVYQTLSTKLTENYDPTGTIKEEIFTTLTQLTRFPDPVGTNKSRSIKGQCPCICCEMGCKNPLDPYSTIHAKAPVTSDASFTALPASSRVLPRQSFLAMTEASSDPNRSLKDKKPKFGFLSFGRLGRSRSQVDLTQEAASQTSVSGKRGSRFSLPAPAPALPDSVTGEVVPPHGKSARSRSFSDLVRRRRKKHMAAISAEAIPSLPAGASSITQEKARASQSVDDETLRLPTRSSSQNHLAGGMGFTARPGRHSLDTTRVDTPFEGPQPPPRRSSKMYAIVGRKPVPQLNASSSNSSLGVREGGATMPRSGKSIYEIGQIAEEDEDPSDGIRSSEADRRGSMARRQSAMISDFEPTSNGAFYENYPPQATAGSVLRSSGGGNGTQAWGFRSVKSNRSEGPLSASATTKPLNVGDETQIGVAI